MHTGPVDHCHLDDLDGSDGQVGTNNKRRRRDMITMTPRALRYYYESRKFRKFHYSEQYGRMFPGGTAKASREYAIRRDAVETEFNNLKQRGLVGLRFPPDDHWCFEDLEGDAYDVDLNKDTVPGGERTIKAQQKEFRRKVEQDGVFGIEAVALGNVVDSIWGFAGDYDDDFGGYGTDMKQAAIDAVQEQWEDDQSGEH
jgi:hypothetical protein